MPTPALVGQEHPICAYSTQPSTTIAGMVSSGEAASTWRTEDDLLAAESLEGLPESEVASPEVNVGLKVQPALTPGTSRESQKVVDQQGHGEIVIEQRVALSSR